MLKGTLVIPVHDVLDAAHLQAGVGENHTVEKPELVTEGHINNAAHNPTEENRHVGVRHTKRLWARPGHHRQ
jgi:hypothetical protein